MESKCETKESAREEALQYMATFQAVRSTLASTDVLNSFATRDTDVIISSFPKSGNALLAQMCYQIAVASGGACDADKRGTDFEDLVQIAPWIENMSMLKLQPWESSPRIFKTHHPVPLFLPANYKFIVLIRNPEVIPHSMLNFTFSAIVGSESDAAKVSDDVREHCVNLMAEALVFDVRPNSHDGLTAWHTHTKACLDARSDRVLVLFYERIIADLEGTAHTVAKFMNCELTSAALETVMSRCDQTYMANDPKFHGLIEKEALKIGAPVKHAQPKDFIGFKKFQINDDLKRKLRDMNRRAFGVETYDEIVHKFGNGDNNCREHSAVQNKT